MQSEKEIAQRLSDAYGKRERLASTLARHRAILEKKMLNFEQRFRISPDGPEDVLRENEQAYWERFAIMQKRDDIAATEKKIVGVDNRIEELRADLRAAEARRAFVDNEIPDIIKDFFERWKQESISFFSNRYEEYLAFVQKLHADEYAARREALSALPEYAQYASRAESMSEYELNNVYPRQPMERYLHERELDYKSIAERKRSVSGDIVQAMCHYGNSDERAMFLETTMEREMRGKLLDLAQRIGKSVGKITDARGLHVSNGEIAGVIIGEHGSASIQTIGAGGYNVQRFHFRTLVHTLEQFEEQSDCDDDDEGMEM